MTVLTMSEVTLTYPDGDGRITALDDVGITVERGEFLALVGPSGSGKSSLLAVAATLIRPDRGRVVIEGLDTTGLSQREHATLRRRRVGIVFQEPNLLDSLTALEQLTVMAALDGRSPRKARTEAVELLTAVGLHGHLDRRPAHLSGGERQRVNIARALMGSPGLLLVDEPTSALDHGRGAEVMGLLRRVTRERDLGTIVVTHDTGHVRDTDRVVHCTDGRVTEAPARGSRAS